MKLYNRVDREVLKRQLEADNTARRTLSFYKYHHIKNPNLFRDHLYYNWSKVGVMGRIYVAHEGINAQISVPSEKWEAFFS